MFASSTPARDLGKTSATRGPTRVTLAWLALVIALFSLAGSLWLSIGMKLRACPLCFYQRTFMMALVAVLAMGILTRTGHAGRLALLSLPLATAGLGVAAFHVFLEATGTLECPQGVFDIGSAPQQSLAVFLALFGLLLADVICGDGASSSPGALAAALLVGLLLAVASCTSNPPMPEPPTTPYPKPPDICRPPARVS
jgi:disulfide bond formation protein DsbB